MALMRQLIMRFVLCISDEGLRIGSLRVLLVSLPLNKFVGFLN